MANPDNLHPFPSISFFASPPYHPCMPEVHNVIIIGSGPAGYTAGIYASRGGLVPLLFAGYASGGQLMLTTDVENFPGYPEGVTGPEMMMQLRQQAERFGTTVIDKSVSSVDFTAQQFKVVVEDETHLARAVIVATGAEAIWLGAEGEEALRGRGVSACATCDGAFFRDKQVLVVGGGDSAMEEAQFLTRFASRVTIVHRREGLRASRVMGERARANPKIAWKLNRVVKRWLSDGMKLTGALLENPRDGTTKEYPCDGAFMAIGHRPVTGFLDGQLKTDARGYLIWQEHTATSVPGVFAAGDVVDTRYRQAITAAGSGCMAAIDCERWLEAQDEA